jgi:hypothetical protein
VAAGGFDSGGSVISDGHHEGSILGCRRSCPDWRWRRKVPSSRATEDEGTHQVLCASFTGGFYGRMEGATIFCSQLSPCHHPITTTDRLLY